MPRRSAKAHVNKDTIDNGNCNEALISTILDSFNNDPRKERFAPWSVEDERKAIRKWAKRNPRKLKNEMISHNVFLAAKFIKKYKNRFYSISTEDLVSNIYWGLVQAAEKFDVTRGTRFGTYAYKYLFKWVLQPFQTNQWKVANATTHSFNCISGKDADGDDPMSATESSILSEADGSFMPAVPEDPVEAVMRREEEPGKVTCDDLIGKMRAYALSGAFSEEEHRFYTRKYIDGWCPKEIRAESNMTIGEYRRIDKRISDSLSEYMKKSVAR